MIDITLTKNDNIKLSINAFMYDFSLDAAIKKASAASLTALASQQLSDL
ncbi:hypothetical protein J3T65_04230 [Staphylococcus simiae]|nr:hypothetical protein [Staphylococcus simiae]MBO1203137.1 hypothetical protein [Staphylococcus simiae]MBO1229240.1 hypothetical protein [Staphylococcus simiae]